MLLRYLRIGFSNLFNLKLDVLSVEEQFILQFTSLFFFGIILCIGAAYGITNGHFFPCLFARIHQLIFIAFISKWLILIVFYELINSDNIFTLIGQAEQFFFSFSAPKGHGLQYLNFIKILVFDLLILLISIFHKSFSKNKSLERQIQKMIIPSC